MQLTQVVGSAASTCKDHSRHLFTLNCYFPPCHPSRGREYLTAQIWISFSTGSRRPVQEGSVEQTTNLMSRERDEKAGGVAVEETANPPRSCVEEPQQKLSLQTRPGSYSCTETRAPQEKMHPADTSSRLAGVRTPVHKYIHSPVENCLPCCPAKSQPLVRPTGREPCNGRSLSDLCTQTAGTCPGGGQIAIRFSDIIIGLRGPL